jgi:hypothetical protein
VRSFCRFKEDVGEIARLREKEKGDWKKLTKEICFNMLRTCQLSVDY